jgi:hypothetical protein
MGRQLAKKVVSSSHSEFQNKRKQRVSKNGFFHSSFFKFEQYFPQRTFARTFQRVLKRVCHHIILHDIYDNMKAPYGTNAAPAILSKAPFNIYYGMNKELLHDGSVKRATYGVCSGSITTGLDMRFQRLLPFTPDMLKLRDLSENIALAYCGSKNVNFDCKFDAASVKIYSRSTPLGAHTDMEFDWKHREPLKNNSQKPNTLVVIITFGDTKILEFGSYSGGGRGAKLNGVDTLTYRQRSGSVLILDPRDEYFNSKLTYWKHHAYLEDKQKGVSMSIMFRVTQSTRCVDPSTSIVIGVPNAGCKGGTKGDFEKALDGGWRSISGSGKQQYEVQKMAILEKIKTRLANYW